MMGIFVIGGNIDIFSSLESILTLLIVWGGH
jgi:hypothetical protein